MRALLLLSPLLLAVTHPCPLPPPPDGRPCWQAIMRLDENRDPDGALPPGGEDPKCDAQGYFRPKQCSGAECYCVDRNGNQLPSLAGKRYFRNRWEADNMKCRCAVEEAEIEAEGTVARSVRCDDIGNYHHTQCTGTQCYCVSPHTGKKEFGTETNLLDFDQLEARCAQGLTK